MQDPLLPPLAAIAAGILVSRLTQFDTRELCIVITAFGILCGIALWRRARVLAGACCLLGLLFAGALVDLAHRPGPPPELDAEGREPVILSGCVVQPPALSGDRERFVVELEPGARVQATAYAREGQEPPALRYGQRVEFEAREIVDAGFLELVRYGVCRAGDPLMVDSLKVVDAVLKRGLPQGPGWLRYNWDGYGDKPDGGPFQGWGKGHVWPLLTGERAHYELAAGHDITELIRTYEGFATCGQMMPEQVWDEPNLPGTSLRLGQPGGSAVPLVWAHAEYLKLLRSAVDGKVFDRIDPVYERYCEPEGRKRRRGDLEIYSRRRPIQKIAVGETLRILDGKPFKLVWSADNWQTTQAVNSRSLGSAGHCADIKAGAQSSKLAWTQRWPEPDSWLGYNVEVQVEGKEHA